MISFIVPAYNEEALIARTLEALHNAASEIFEAYEIIVVDDASCDSTAEIAKACGARVIQVNLRQIAATRNAGAREAAGDKFIFVDADTLVSKAVVRAAVEEMNRGAAGGGSSVTFDEPVPRYARLLNQPLANTFRVLGIACGCFLFCTRDAFDRVNGFDEELFASEEIWMSRALKRAGRFVVLRESVITSGRKLRMYSGKQVVKLFTGILLTGPNALKRRDGLEIWYGGRRERSDLLSDTPPQIGN